MRSHSAWRFAASRVASSAALVLTLAVWMVGRAHADDFIVYTPYVMATKKEIELRGFHVNDARSDQGGDAAELSISYGVNDWWKPELYLLEYAKDPGSSGRLEGYEFENTFQITPAGQYFADFGFLASYGHSTVADAHDTVEFGPLIAMTAGRIAHAVNLIWEKEVGSGADGRYEFRYSYAGTYAYSKGLQAGLEAYGRPADRAYQAGPIIKGEWNLFGTSSNLGYRLGVLLGINADAPRQTWLAQFEYEFF